MEKDLLNKFGEKVLAWLNNTEAFMTEQIPDVIQQLLTWKMAEALTWLTIGFLFMGFSVWGIKRMAWMLSADTKHEDYFEVAIPILGILSGIGSLLSPVIVISNIFTVLQLWLAPKVYLLEYVKGLIQ